MRMSNRNQASALSRLEGKHSCVASSCMCVRRYSICRAADRRAPVSVSVGACCTCGWQRPCRTAMAMWIPRVVRRHAKKDPQPQTKRITSLQAKLLPVRAFPSHLLVEPQHGHVPVAVGARCTRSYQLQAARHKTDKPRGAVAWAAPGYVAQTHVHGVSKTTTNVPSIHWAHIAAVVGSLPTCAVCT